MIDSSLEKVNDVVLIQSMWGRLMDFGQIEIMTASEKRPTTCWIVIKSPVKFKTAMLDQKRGHEQAATGRMTPLGGPPAGVSDIPDIIAELDGPAQERYHQRTGVSFRKKEELLGKL